MLEVDRAPSTLGGWRGLTLERRAAEILFRRVLSSAIFDAFPPLYKQEGSRRSCLDLPFRREGFRGAWLPPVRPA